jgi:Tol biopolymer transport system component
LAQENTAYPLCSEQPIMSRERIVFTAYYEDGEDVYIADPESNKVCLLLENTYALHLDWSPDGNEIAFGEFKSDVGYGYVNGPYFVHLDGTPPREIEWIHPGADGVYWSPDSTQLVYRRHDQTVDSGAIVIQDVLTGMRIAGYEPGIEDYHVLGEPVWSPDGMRIAVPGAFLMFDIQNPILTDIYVFSLNGHQDLVFSHFAGISGEDFAPTWSPDGSMIAYTSEEDNEQRLFITDIKTGETHESPLEIASYSNNWLPDGRLAFIAEDGDNIYGLYVTDASMTGDWTTVTQVQLPFPMYWFDWWIDPSTLPTPDTP